MSRYFSIFTAVFLAIMVISGSLGCSDDDVIGGGSGVPAPTLENIWPNEDGRAWEYLMTSTTWTDGPLDSTYIYADEDSVPPAPPLSVVQQWVESPYVPEPSTSTLSSYELAFDGMAVSGTGVEGQNLVETIEDVPISSSFEARLLNVLAVARPDLREKIALMGAGSRRGAQAPAEALDPLLLHGGVWEKTASWIGTYGDVDTLLAWKFLGAGLNPGDMFTHQLVPALAPDVFLTGWVVRKGPVATGVGTFDRAIECVYLIDYGISEFTTVFSPDAMGYSRFVGVGKVAYAPTVGPVALYERVLISAGDPLGTGVGDITMDLKSITAGAEAAP